MKTLLLLLGFQVFLFSHAICAKPPSYITTSNGVIVFTDPLFTGTSKAVKLEVIADNIIRVIAAPGKGIFPVQSLMTIYTAKAGQGWNVIPAKEILTLKTKSITAVVNLKTGVVSFWDAKGKKILGEKRIAARSFQSAIFDGKRYYNLTQTFQTTSDDAWYGLGQHQDGIMNYRGQQVTFFQNNTEVAIPFLVSSKNYGILWDNYSLTRVGDVRPLHPISSLQIFSKN